MKVLAHLYENQPEKNSAYSTLSVALYLWYVGVVEGVATAEVSLVFLVYGLDQNTGVAECTRPMAQTCTDIDTRGVIIIIISYKEKI